MRKLAFLVGIGLCLSIGAYAAPGADLSVRPLTTASAATGYSTAEHAPEIDAFDLAEDTAMSDGLIALALWLPIAGILLALAMEEPVEDSAGQARSSLWVE